MLFRSLLEWYDERGLKWQFGENALHKFNWSGIGKWEYFKKNTCYNHTKWVENKGMYGNVDYYKEDNYTIITVKEFFNILNK